MACVADNVLDGLAVGGLTDEEALDALHHLEECATCRDRLEERSASTEHDVETVVEGLRKRQRERALDGKLTKGTTLGRYVVVEQIGAGGMGVVYVAYDPELHRKVALKLLHPGGAKSEASAGRARLLREAQAMAQLSHPNVIHVYDVGTFEDHVFLALEFIDGETLLKWLRRTARPWREVLRVFIAAGRGLAAAHAAGLVHRDFKPDNVLIGKDGRVLVTDFGLARVDGDVDSGDDLAPVPSPRDSKPLFQPLTTIGSVIGTPGYAAPEFFGGTADARGDQFSFAASLWAGLYRKRPYSATTFAKYKSQLATGLPEPPADAKVPLWLRRAVERGLAAEPSARYSSMDAFLDALSRDPARTRRRWLVAGGAIAVVALATGLTVSALASHEDRALLCQGAERKLAGVWDGERRDKVRAAFEATKRPYWQQAFDGVASRLDARTRAWTAMHTEACEATQLRGEQPENVMALRMACLDQRRRETAQLVEVLAAADPTIVDRSVRAASELAPLDDCANVSRLLATVAQPADPATRMRVDELRTVLGRAKALNDAGKYKDAVALATRATADAHALGYRPVEAEALLKLGEFESYLGESEAAAKSLRDAIREADATHDDAVRARAFAWLVGVVGYDLGKGTEGLSLGDDARAALERLGGDGYVEALLESNLGRTSSVVGDYQHMLEHHRNALSLRMRQFGEDDPMTANSHNNVGAAFNKLGRYTDALAEHEKALAVRTKLFGPDHPDVAMSDSNVASQYYEMGELEKALAGTDAAIASAKKTMPAKSSLVTTSLANRAELLAELERFDEATAAFGEILATLEATAPKTPRYARALAARAGLVLAVTGKPAQAIADADRAAEIATASAGKPNDAVAAALAAKARALEAQGKLDAALAALHRALDIDDGILGKDNPAELDIVTAIGRVELARKHTPEAVAYLERALAMCDTGNLRGKWRARTQFTLARALWEAGQHERAMSLAKEANDWYAASPLVRSRAEVAAWLAKNR